MIKIMALAYGNTAAYNVKKLLHYFYLKLVQIYSLDLRSLALLRIGVGVVILVDLLIRSQDLVAHYTDAGIMSRSLIVRYGFGGFSFHLAHGGPLFIGALFVIAALFALALIVGYRTRLATILSWIFLISLQSRAPFVGFGADQLLAASLMWGTFLPWGAVFSVDSALRGTGDEPPTTVFSLATIAYVLQIVILYTFSVLHKFGIEWVRDGNAIYYALSKDDFMTSVGQFLLQFPHQLQYMTWSVYVVELLIPMLILFPFFNPLTRLIAVIVTAGLQIGIGSSLTLGIFPLISIASTFGLLPSFFWNRPNSVRLRASKIKLYYDDKCSFCVKIVNTLKTFLIPQNVTYVPASQIKIVMDEMHKRHSWVVVGTNERKSWQFEAFVQLLRSSRLFFFLYPFFNLRPIRFVGNRLYLFLSTRFHTSCELKTEGPSRRIGFSLNVVEKGLVLFLLTYVILWNVSPLRRLHFNFPRNLIAVGNSLQINQNWALFASFGRVETGWYVMKGTLKNGAEVDLMRRGRSVSDERPPLEWLHPNERWQKLLENGFQRGSKYRRQAFQYNIARYFCSQWNEAHSGSQTTQRLEIIYYSRWILPDYSATDVQKRTLFVLDCFKAEYSA